MDRMYKAPHKVNVYRQHGDNKPVKVVRTKPYSYQGYENYRVDSIMYPGFMDERDAGADACVYLDQPL